ncbi:putative nuclease HARBI1 [Eurosta solidaginis]|uniref:putative nuclease HARBI1 n=1 Tax=Eurosta solidaginis TaxID=178769 RepID=UPI0035312B8A
MEPELLFFLESSDEDVDGHDQKVVRRQLRDKSNPLSLSENAFIKRFRLNKAAFNYVLRNTNFNCHSSAAAPPIIQLAVTLSFLGSGSYQRAVGDDYLMGMSQSLVSKLSTIVVTEIERNLCPEHIRFTLESLSGCMEWFYEKYKIPRVIGCIDGTHIGLQKPSENEHMFFNRKGFHNLNVMIICDHQYKINVINARYGGAAHDSFVWKQSEQRIMLEEKFEINSNNNSWLLGDSGYPLEPWCITPYRNPAEGSSESVFNAVHSKARCMVERTIGIYKGRWKILCNDKRGRYTPQKVAMFSNVCAALHNICMEFKVPFNQPSVTANDVAVNDIDIGEHTQILRIGQNIRNQIKQSLLN